MNEYFVGHETPDEEMAYGFIDTLDANFDDKISRTSNANADLRDLKGPICQFWMYLGEHNNLLNNYFRVECLFFLCYL